MSEDTFITKSIYLELSQEYYVHQNYIREAALEDCFKFTHLILSPEVYTQVMASPELKSYYFFGGASDLFPGIAVMISPMVDRWKWVCDFN